MGTVYDSTDVNAIPADATEILAYTDGVYANVDKVRARFPNARIYTISAIGVVIGEWIDCEPGCVWGPEVAAGVYEAWQGKGCIGIYTYRNNLDAVQQAIAAKHIDPKSLNYWDADFMGTPVVDAGVDETQYQSFPTFDVSITDGKIDPPILPPKLKEEDMALCNDASGQYIVAADASGRLRKNPLPPGTDVEAIKAGGTPAWGTQTALLASLPVAT